MSLFFLSFVLIINIENKYQHLIKINFYPFLSIFLGVTYIGIIISVLLYLFFIECLYCWINL